jgi:hypothetical protein
MAEAQHAADAQINKLEKENDALALEAKNLKSHLKAESDAKVVHPPFMKS